METWKPVTGYEGLYEVSDAGQVRSLPRIKNGKTGTTYLTKQKTLSQKVGKDGYLNCTLTDRNGNARMFRVNRLVATAFHENPEGKEVVHHKDQNIKNNSASNLEWVTTKENLYASDVYGQLSEKFRKPISCETVDGKPIGNFRSVRQASEYLNIDARHISAVINGRRKSVKNYRFHVIPKVVVLGD